MKGFLRHTPKKGSHLNPVIHVNACCAPTDCVYPRQMVGGLPQGIHDSVKVVLGVGLEIGVPRRFVAENHFPICDRCRLAITAAKIEPDATAFQMPPERSG